MADATTQRTRLLALAIALAGLAITACVELVLTSGDASDPLGWFVYEAVAWLALLGIGPFLPVSAAVLIGAAIALGLEVAAFWRVFVLDGGAQHAHLYLWKPLVQLALVAGAWLAGYLLYLRALRARAHG